ncbi:MAG: hypothetical protein ACD_2C00001G0007 [uncultured bacterium (gcode 4)]|uniref:Cyclic nucleotide-binding domain-containing protein n=1 Tax=uncultured bacterium (gcode 4) TaxID=1234023 RepID=K2G7I7_9BACT|nr:MAG: hypothetical protein ACD_2C00001G0007 [uncultured bacterium (gcode 4)]
MGNDKIEKHKTAQETQIFDKEKARDDIESLKSNLKIEKPNPIIAYLEKFDTYFKKKKRLLEAWELLFSPWIDKNFYIITSWTVDIFRYTFDWQRKEIWNARAWSFIGEWVIFWRFQKDVEAVASTNAQVFALSREDLALLEKESPQEAMELYKYIIEITNKRLLDSWKELANIYEATNKIIELAKNWEKSFPDVMQYLKNLLMVDYITFVENHPAIDGFFFYKYSTELGSVGNLNRKAWGEISSGLSWHYSWDIPFFWSGKKDSVYVLPLKNWDKLKWYLIAWKKKWMVTDNEMRISTNIWPLLGSIVENNQKETEKKAKEMSKNYFDKGISSI